MASRNPDALVPEVLSASRVPPASRVTAYLQSFLTVSLPTSIIPELRFWAVFSKECARRLALGG